MKKLLFRLTDAEHKIAAQAVAEFQAEEDGELPERFDGVLVMEDTDSGDGRYIHPEALTWRELPLPIMMPNDNGDHHTDRIAGRIEILERRGKDIWMNGAFDMEGEEGREASRLVEAQLLRWVSVELDMVDADLIETDDCQEIDGETICDYRMEVTSGRITGGVLVPTPAFPGAVIVPEGTEIPPATEDGRKIAAAASNVTQSFFSDPKFDALQKWTFVDEDTREVKGHLFGWGECHAGYAGTCLTPDALMANTNLERSNNVGALKLEDGSLIGVSPLCLKGHSTAEMDFARACDWMNDPRNAVADVVYGKDDHGVWFHGALRPDATDAAIHNLRASGVSGEWHFDEGERVLLGACVNVPGYAKMGAKFRDDEVVAACLSFQKPAPEACGCEAGEVILATTQGPVTVNDDLLVFTNDNPAGKPLLLSNVEANYVTASGASLEDRLAEIERQLEQMQLANLAEEFQTC